MVQHANPSLTGGAGEPGVLPTSRSDRIRQLNTLLDAVSAHQIHQLPRIFESSDSHARLLGSFVGPPYPVVSGERIKRPLGEFLDVEGMVMSHQTFHFCLSSLLCPVSEIRLRVLAM